MKVWKELKRCVAHQYMRQYLDAEHYEQMYEEHLEEEWSGLGAWPGKIMDENLMELEQDRVRAAVLVADAIRHLPKHFRGPMRRRYIEGRRIRMDEPAIRRGLEKVNVSKDFFKERIVSMIESELDHGHDEPLPFD